MDITTANNYLLSNLNKVNIILGKNGSGKSNFLRDVETPGTRANNPEIGITKYITPERGGVLQYSAGMEENIGRNQNYLPDNRRRNQHNEFKLQTVALYSRLETMVLREIENDVEKRKQLDYRFDNYLDQINKLLDNIEIRRDDIAFKIYKKGEVSPIQPESISSGESELIALAIELLSFQKEALEGKTNILCVDEPDAHLHPDLQVRLMELFAIVAQQDNILMLIATHSTAILGAFSDNPAVSIAFKLPGIENVTFLPIKDEYKRLLPIFGAHPLTNVFNQVPILLVEGEDDCRVWQQAVRTSQGLLKLYPCSTDTISKMSDYENDCEVIMTAVYENAKGYSLRDSDGTVEQLDDLPHIRRFRLECNCVENLLLSDEVIASLGLDWDTLKMKMDDWIDKHDNSHSHFDTMKKFQSEGYERKTFDFKLLRNDIMGIVGSEKPWEIAVGQVIGEIKWDSTTKFDDNSIAAYLGQKLVKAILPNS